MTETILEVKDLEVQYKTELETVYAVNGISFRLNEGETLGIVGETGAGKTTTALSVLRLLPERVSFIPKGEIYFQGQNLLEMKENELRKIRGEKIAMIFQDPMTSLNPVMTVGEQILEALIFHRAEKAEKAELEKRVDEVLTMVGIAADRKADYPHQFSGGMKQRVVIAMALACEPELLIADEPTTALDVTIQAQVLLMIRNLRDRLKTAMIMITHDLGIVAQTCDNVAVMYAGELIESGTAEDIFCAEKHHPYTEGLFGSIPSLRVYTERLNPIAGLMPDPTERNPGCKFAPRCPKVMAICRSSHPEDAVENTHRIKCHLYSDGITDPRKEEERL